MNKDLISKETAIEKVWSVFNSEYNDANKYSNEETAFANKVLSNVQKALETLPIAYDIDKVIEDVEYCSTITFHFDGSKPDHIVNFVDVMRIVENGGEVEND